MKIYILTFQSRRECGRVFEAFKLCRPPTVVPYKAGDDDGHGNDGDDDDDYCGDGDRDGDLASDGDGGGNDAGDDKMLIDLLAAPLNFNEFGFRDQDYYFNRFLRKRIRNLPQVSPSYKKNWRITKER